MQRLEFSGAVRPLYGSLGVKGLKGDNLFSRKADMLLLSPQITNITTTTTSTTCPVPQSV